MMSKVRFQKKVFHRILQLHCLKSRTENVDLLKMAVDDPIIFELTYENVVDRFAMLADSDFPIQVGRNDSQEVVVDNCSEFLHWLSANRLGILDEIGTIVEALGGIEVAHFLMEEESGQGVCRCVNRRSE